MSAITVMPPFPIFNDTNGAPLQSGYVYVGVAGMNAEANPIPVFWDSALTIPAAQPLRTSGGYVSRNGSPAQVYADAVDFSLLVKNKGKALVWSSLFVSGIGANASGVSYTPAGEGAVPTTVEAQLRQTIYVSDFGAPTDGTDATSHINAAILAAYKAKTIALETDTIYGVVVKCSAGKDYKILGKILIPSGVTLDLNGSRFIGASGTAGSDAYSAIGQHMFETAYWDGATLVSNAAAVNETTWQVNGGGVVNGVVQNVNCPFNLINFQVSCSLDNLRIYNSSCIGRLKNSFYARYGASNPITARNVATAAGQWAVLLHGAAAHELEFDIRIIGASIGYEVTATNSFSVEVGGSFEEGYASGSIGIRNNGAYCQGWKVHAYVEGVRKGITTINGGAFFASDFSPAYFSSTEYAVQAGESGFRKCTFDCVSVPDEGAGTRNLLDFSAANNEVLVRVDSKSGSTAGGVTQFPTNVLLSEQSQALGTSIWRENGVLSNSLGMAQPALAQKNKLNSMPFEGANIVTLANQIPFCSAPVVAATSATLDTLLTFDTSNALVFNFQISDFNGTYNIHGTAFGTTVYRNDAAAPTVTISNNAGNVRVTFGSIDTNGGASFVARGMIRHF